MSILRAFDKLDWPSASVKEFDCRPEGAAVKGDVSPSTADVGDDGHGGDVTARS